MPTPPAHLPREKRKALTVRLAAATIFEDDPEDLHDPDAARDYILLRRSVLTDADRLESDKGDLDKALRRWVSWLTSQPIPGGNGHAPISRRVAQLAKAVLFKCKDCSRAGKATAICTGDMAADSQVVAAGKGGRCIRAFHELNAIATALVGRAYAQSGIAFAAPQVTFGTGFLVANTGSALAREFGVSGTCAVESDGASSHVVLKVRDEGFEPKSLRVVFYVLVHELLCHAYQGLDGKRREAAGARCSWSEGWMDSLAALLCTNWISADAGGIGKLLVHAREKVLRDSLDYHDKRYNDDFLADDLAKESDRNLRRYAATTFKAMKAHWDAQSQEVHPLEQHLITRFSMTLNACSLTLYERRDLIAGLRTALDDPGTRGACLRACGSFAGNGRVADLVSAVRCLGLGCEAGAVVPPVLAERP